MNEQEIRDAIKLKEQEIEDLDYTLQYKEEEKRKLQESLEFVLYGLKPGMHIIKYNVEYKLIKFNGLFWVARKIKKDGGLYATENTIYLGGTFTIKDQS